MVNFELFCRIGQVAFFCNTLRYILSHVHPIPQDKRMVVSRCQWMKAQWVGVSPVNWLTDFSDRPREVLLMWKDRTGFSMFFGTMSSCGPGPAVEWRSTHV